MPARAHQRFVANIAAIKPADLEQWRKDSRAQSQNYAIRQAARKWVSEMPVMAMADLTIEMFILSTFKKIITFLHCDTGKKLVLY